MNNNSLIKAPNQPLNLTSEQIVEYKKCADPVTGPHYFLSNYFYVQHPTKGNMLYVPYNYQTELIDTYHNHRYSISLLSRQLGKSVTAAGYLLWYAMFKPDSTILIASNKHSSALEIMHRVRYAYEYCPDFIKCGVKTYNKGSIDFDNESRIISQATTENTGRGMSISLLFCLDGKTSFVRIRDKTTLVEEETSLVGLFKRLYQPKNIIDVDSILRENTKYEIMTPDGWKAFKGIVHSGKKETYKITLKSGNSVVATATHSFFKNGIKTKTSDLSVGDYIDTIDSIELNQIIDILKTEISDVYDIVEVDNENHSFIVNGNIITKNCDEFAFVRPTIAREFWTSISPTLSTGGKCIITSTPNSDEDQFWEIWLGANRTTDEFGNTTDVGQNGFKSFSAYWHQHPERTKEWAAEERAKIGEERFEREHNLRPIIFEETLILPIHLSQLSGIEPIETQGQVRWYAKPDKKKTYAVALDPSLGTGSDNAAIQVFQLPEMIQVAEWCHNKTPVQRQVVLLKEIVNSIAGFGVPPESVYYSVENNTLGEAALLAIQTIGEENIKGIFLSEPKKIGQARRYRRGFNTTNKSKVTTCLKLKALVETKRIALRSKPLISELKAFVALESSFKAKPGATDDLVMSLILVLRMTHLLQEFDPAIGDHMRDDVDEYIEPLPFLASFYQPVFAVNTTS